MAVDRVLLARPRGFCAGVEMSIKALIWLRSAFPERRVYCYHGIVHNRLVIGWFQVRGVQFVESLNEIPSEVDEDVALMLSAHGTSPDVVETARTRFPIVIDAACPLVTKVHFELSRRAETTDDAIVYLGEKHHDEAIGTLGVASRMVHVVSSTEEVEALQVDGQSISLLTQTTLPYELHASVASALRNRFDSVWTARKSDLCFATTNRQEAVRALAEQCDTIIVVGSHESANTMSLVKVAEMAGVHNVVRANHPSEIPDNLTGIVGVTAGASAPESLVLELCASLGCSNEVEEIDAVVESEYFPPPRDLRTLADGNPDRAGAYDLQNDRNIMAGDLMGQL
jgi:4-hydroxy-3-methylbut-2-en-1-yl diphosphate reductase